MNLKTEKKLIRNKNSSNCLELGDKYFFGIGVNINYTNALRFYMKHLINMEKPASEIYERIANVYFNRNKNERDLGTHYIILTYVMTKQKKKMNTKYHN